MNPASKTRFSFMILKEKIGQMTRIEHSGTTTSAIKDVNVGTILPTFLLVLHLTTFFFGYVTHWSCLSTV
ncbi:unnamed protein product [Lathyrus oleraceus]